MLIKSFFVTFFGDCGAGGRVEGDDAHLCVRSRVEWEQQ